jgi:hypothetical protein
MYPPSLPDDVKARAFRATNGEFGVLPADAASFLRACRSDGVEVFGWELWVVDHDWDIRTNWPVPAKGLWCGGIPMRNYFLLAVVGGDGDADETERQLAALNLSTEVRPDWLPPCSSELHAWRLASAFHPKSPCRLMAANGSRADIWRLRGRKRSSTALLS